MLQNIRASLWKKKEYIRNRAGFAWFLLTANRRPLQALGKASGEHAGYSMDYKETEGSGTALNERTVRQQEAGMSDGRAEVIVSLTSYGARLKKVHYTVRSILQQTVRPDRIILYLDGGVTEAELPSELLQMKEYGLELEVRPEPLKPHKKYYYAMQEHPEAIVITVDDDLIYPPYTIEMLLDGYAGNRGCVIAARAHCMTFDADGQLLPYNDWVWEDYNLTEPSFLLLATGVGGVLYPPHLLDTVLFDLDLIRELSFGADDIWLKAVEMKSGVPVLLLPDRIWKHVIEVPGSQKVSLGRANVDRNENDVYIRNCFEYFGIDTEELFQESLRRIP